MPVEQEACASTTLAESRGKSMEKVLEAANLVKLGNAAELTRCLASLSEASELNHRDPEGRETTSQYCARPLLITIFFCCISTARPQRPAAPGVVEDSEASHSIPDRTPAAALISRR